MLKTLGVDTNVYQAHSICAASTSKTNLRGLSTEDMLQRGNWSRKSTWQTFYNKNISTPAERLQNKLFSEA